MNTNIDFDKNNAENLVYIREVETATLPKEVRDQAEGFDTLFAVHDSEGERLALVADRRMAFSLAREHEMTPVSVH